MGLSTNLNTYSDVRKVFDAALAQKGVRVRLDSYSAAVRFRHRAYYFRKLLYNHALATATSPGQLISTPYDKLIIKIDKNILTVIEREVPGEILPLDSDEPIEIDDADPLLDEAKNLKLNLLGDPDA